MFDQLETDRLASLPSVSRGTESPSITHLLQGLVIDKASCIFWEIKLPALNLLSELPAGRVRERIGHGAAGAVNSHLRDLKTSKVSPETRSHSPCRAESECMEGQRGSSNIPDSLDSREGFAQRGGEGGRRTLCHQM